MKQIEKLLDRPAGKLRICDIGAVLMTLSKEIDGALTNDQQEMTLAELVAKAK